MAHNQTSMANSSFQLARIPHPPAPEAGMQRMGKVGARYDRGMDEVWPVRKSFVTRSGGMPYRGRGDMYQKVNIRQLPATVYRQLAAAFRPRFMKHDPRSAIHEPRSSAHRLSAPSLPCSLLPCSVLFYSLFPGPYSLSFPHPPCLRHPPPHTQRPPHASV